MGPGRAATRTLGFALQGLASQVPGPRAEAELERIQGFVPPTNRPSRG
jgi:hypothetical protein